MIEERSARRAERWVAGVDARFRYPVLFTRDALAPANGCLAEALRQREPGRPPRAFFIVDSGVAAAAPRVGPSIEAYARFHRIALAGAPLVVEGGESGKNLPAVPEWLRARLCAAGLDRESHVVVIGGGSLLDAAGFAAATTHRGLRVTRLPSTALAQSACLGARSSLNAFGKKDLMGVFAPPFAVVVDARLLETLPRRELAGGAAEALRVALLRGADFVAWLEEAGERLAAGELSAYEALVRRSARHHLELAPAEGEPFEARAGGPGSDFGRWAARALEVISRSRIPHGDAVALGLAVDLKLSMEHAGLDRATCERALAWLRRLGLPVFHETMTARGPDGRLLLFDGLVEFQAQLGSDARPPLLAGLAHPAEAPPLDETALERAVDGLRAEAAR